MKRRPPFKSIFGLSLLWLGLLPWNLGLGQTLDGNRLFAQWVSQLEPVSQHTFEELRAIDPEAIRRNMRREDVLRVDMPSYRKILDQMVLHGWGAMDLFAHPFFGRGSKVLYFDNTLVRLSSTEYDIPALFPAYGFTRKDYRMKTRLVPKGSFFVMERLLLGDGRLITTYPMHVSIHRDDPLFGVLTGNYEIYSFNVADIGSVRGGSRVLARLRGRDDPEASFQEVRAVLNFPVRQMVVHPATPRRVDILFYVWWHFAHPAIVKIEPPLYARRSEGFGDVPRYFLSETQALAGHLQPDLAPK